MKKEIRECQECETILTAGYEFEGSAFCPACASKLGVALHHKLWCEWEYIANNSGKPQVYKGYRMHDNLYFDRSTALLFDDGKDRVETVYFLIMPDEIYYEGGQMENYFTGKTEDEVRETYLDEEDRFID